MSNRQIQVVEAAGMYLLGSFSYVSSLLGSLLHQTSIGGDCVDTFRLAYSQRVFL